VNGRQFFVEAGLAVIVGGRADGRKISSSVSEKIISCP
jgi:hypothetical protein